jgi:hypothetical protein
MADQTFDGRKLWILTIVDAATRLCPAIDVRASHRGADVVETLERVTAIHGRPKRIRDRPGHRVYVLGHGPVGLGARCGDGLLQAGQTDR